jgi:hypothetical protein
MISAMTMPRRHSASGRRRGAASTALRSTEATLALNRCEISESTSLSGLAAETDGCDGTVFAAAAAMA